MSLVGMWYAQCPHCGKQFTANTPLWLEEVVREHAKGCVSRPQHAETLRPFDFSPWQGPR